MRAVASGGIGDGDVDVFRLRHLWKDARIDDHVSGLWRVDEIVGGVDP